MRSGRLFEIIYLLMDKKCIPAKSLAEHFEVSTRTIMRDIDELAASGVPIYARRGHGGGVCLMENYMLDKTLIEKDDQDRILFALQSTAATGAVEDRQLIDRLRTLFQKEHADWIEIDFTRWGRSSDKPKFEILRDAILQSRQIDFDYTNANGDSSARSVYPLRLTFKTYAWYLQGYDVDKNDYRTFKISRMRDLCATASTFNPAQFHVPPLSPSPHKTQQDVSICLRFDLSIAHRVYDEFDASIIESTPDGLLVTFSTLIDSALCDYILSFGAHAEVLSPDNLRSAVGVTLSKTLKKYSGGM